MGYEVFLIKTESNREALEEIQKPVPFPPHEALFRRIRERFPGLDDRDPSWAVLCGLGEDDFSVELNIGRAGEPIECIMLVRPSGRDGVWLIRELCRMFQCRAWDGEGPLDFDHPRGWIREALEVSERVRRKAVSSGAPGKNPEKK